MKKLIIINWKWLPVLPLDASEEWTEPTDYINIIDVEGTESKLIQLNLQREEAEFDDEYDELYEPRNQLLQELLADYIEEYKIIVFLHKNAPHYYGEYDIAWFKKYVPKLSVVLFGGGEDFVYDLHNAVSGLLDQVGNFSPAALSNDEMLQTSYFDGIWKHYQGADQLVDTTYSIIRKLLEELLPIFQIEKPDASLIKWAEETIQQSVDLPVVLKEELQQLAQGKLPDVTRVQKLLS